jgi:methylase of polypeptide subunit release factors
LIPLRYGPAASFARIREYLEGCGYTESAVCQRLGLTEQHEVLSRRKVEAPRPLSDALDLLINLFLEGECVEEDAARKFIPDEVWELMTELGLVAKLMAPENLRYSPVVLHPMGRLFIASDRWTNPDHSPFTPQPDIVYPAITKNTCRFLRMLPREACSSFLELCSGTGVAALAAASGGAQRAWAVDITERSTRFAEFNRLLNGVDNATVLQGDLYEPVRGLRFDRIVAHPPYVPAASAKWIFQDAGSEGEDITRGIVSGLADSLSAGGRLYCLSLGADHKGEALEHRVRRWLGDRHTEFDVMVVALNTHTPEQIASQPLLKGTIDHKEFAARRTAFEAAGVEGFVYGLIIVQSIGAEQRPAFTARRQAGARTGSAEFEWALRWESAAASPDVTALLLKSRPVVSKNLELHVLHRVEQGALTPAELTLRTDYPFSMECRVEPWTAALVEACDGTQTGAELHSHCCERGWLAGDVPVQEFAGLLGSLVSGGFVEVEGFRTPAAAE